MSVGFANPWGLLGLLVLGAVALLYVLKAQRQRRVVSSTLLWSGAKRSAQARTPWQRLRSQLSLWLELAAALLAALGLAQATCRGRSLAGSSHALVLDLTASTQARAGSATRFELARAAARELLEGLPGSASVLVLGAGREARVVAPLTRDHRAARAALDALAPEDTEGDPAEALALAVDRLRERSGERRVHYFGDGAPGASALREGPVPVELHVAGAPADNTALTRVDARAARRGAGAARLFVFALVSHHGRAPRPLTLTLRVQGAAQPLATRRFEAPAGARVPLQFELPVDAAPVGAGLELALDPPDALPVDDRAFARVPPSPLLDVALEDSLEQSPWLRRALASDPDVRLVEGTRDAPEGALLVYQGRCPERAPAGHDVLVVAPPEGRCLGLAAGSLVQEPAWRSYESTDARLRFLALEGTHLLRARPLEASGAWRSLWSGPEGSWLAARDTEARGLTVLGFDPAESDWPLRASFVLWVRNVEELARAHRVWGPAGGARTGEALRLDAEEGSARWVVQGEGGRFALEARAGQLVVPPLPRAGLYALREGARSLVLPVNLLSECEADLWAPGLRVERGEGAAARGRALPEEPLARWLALGVFAFLLGNYLWLTRSLASRTERGA